VPLDLNNLDDAEKFQKHFVLPLVEAVRAEVAPLVKNDRKQTERINALESNQKRALAGVAVYATALGLGLDWLRKRIGL
jgi:hypothetical protein